MEIKQSARLVLLTGASGFVGRYVAQDLKKIGWTVIEARRGGNPPSPDLRDPRGNWSELLRDVSIVVHLAAPVLDPVKEDPRSALTVCREANVRGTTLLAQAAARAGVERFVFVSSVKAVGEETRGAPFDESTEPHPVDPYGMSKLEAEQALLQFHLSGQFEAVTLRPPLIYGPEVKGNFLKLLRWVQKGAPLPLAGVQNRRDLLFVGNMSHAIRTAMESAGAAGKRYFVSDNQALSTPELLKRLAEALGTRARLFPAPSLALEFAGKLTGQSSAVTRLTRSLAISTRKIQEELGWKPPFSVEQGLKETALWFRSVYC